MEKKLNKKLGFGCMRLPLIDGLVDLEEFQKMVDIYMSNGFNYFDTARVYIGGDSEKAIRECVVHKYDRESFFLTDKLSGSCFEKEEDVIPFFNSQLEVLDTTYFDYYLMHAQNRNNYVKFMNCHAYDIAKKLKEEGKIKHIGISFHDTKEVLEKILNEHPEIEVVQIQFNYLDFYSPSIQSKELYDLLESRGIDVLIMEPVKGGRLVNLGEAEKIFKELDPNLSNASYAIRFAASFKNVIQVLSGMSNVEQMLDNISYMKDFKPLSDIEFKAIDDVRQILYQSTEIPCTNCRYCVPGCPKQILIPDLFKAYNESIKGEFKEDYHELFDGHIASLCIKCGKCEKICPQHLKVRDLLDKVKDVFE